MSTQQQHTSNQQLISNQEDISNQPIIDEKYQNAKLFYIKNNVSEKIFIGSTILSLEDIFKKHIQIYFQVKNKDLSGYSRSFLIFNEDFESTNIHLLKNYPCNNKHELDDFFYQVKSKMPNIVNKITKPKPSRKSFIQHNQQSPINNTSN